MTEQEKKIMLYLQSDEIGMVRLGARLLQEVIPSTQWDSFLREASRKTVYSTLMGEEFKETSWLYKIDRRRKKGNKVIILGSRETQIQGIWEQVQTHSYQHVYKRDTFNLKTLKKAIGSYLRRNKIKSK